MMEKVLAMPKLGMTMTEGTVLQWLYKEGDLVEKDEALVEVMTDKVNMEVEAPFSGQLLRILAQEGDVLPVGAPMALLVDETTEATSLTSVNGATVAALAANPSTSISSSASVPAANVALLDLPAARTPVAGTPAAKREAALYGIELQAVVQAGAIPPLHLADVLAYMQKQQPPEIRATPIAQKIANEHQVNLVEVAMNKQGKKITRADVEAHLVTIPQATNGKLSPSEEAQQISEGIANSISDHANAQSELIPLSPVRRLIGQRMIASITTAPHIYLDTEIDMLEIERARQRMDHHVQKQGEPVPSVTAFLIRAIAATLLRHPEVNATFEPGALQGKDAIRRWRIVNIGVAVDTEQALLTPVIKNAHLQTMSALASELRRLSQAARHGGLKPDDLAEATFTISNLGMYGIDTFHAIIAPGQGAILAVGKTTKRNVVIEDAQGEHLEIRPIMKVSLSADHRIIDGAAGSRFLQQLKTFLENPYLLL